MISFTDVVLEAGDKFQVKFSGPEASKLYFRQVTTNSKKKKVTKKITPEERRNYIARKALNNWLSQLKNQARPRQPKKIVKKERKDISSTESSQSDEDKECAPEETVQEQEEGEQEEVQEEEQEEEQEEQEGSVAEQSSGELDDSDRECPASNDASENSE